MGTSKPSCLWSFRNDQLRCGTRHHHRPWNPCSCAVRVAVWPYAGMPWTCWICQRLGDWGYDDAMVFCYGEYVCSHLEISARWCTDGWLKGDLHFSFLVRQALKFLKHWGVVDLAVMGSVFITMCPKIETAKRCKKLKYHAINIPLKSTLRKVKRGLFSGNAGCNHLAPTH